MKHTGSAGGIAGIHAGGCQRLPILTREPIGQSANLRRDHLPPDKAEQQHR